jgi:hypothetical protein
MNIDELADREQIEIINDSRKERKETVEFNDLTNQDATLMNNKEDCDTYVKELQEKMKAQNIKFKKFKEKFDSETQIKDEKIKELEKSLKEREKELNEKEKIIYNLNIANSKLMANLDDLKREVDEKLDKVNVKKINDKMKKQKEKENPLEIVLKLKEKELKNKMNLLEILRKDNEQLNKTLESSSSIKAVIDLQDKLKLKEKENMDLANEVKILNRLLEEHKKCVKVKTLCDEEMRNLKEELKKAKEVSKESQLKLKDEECKHIKTKDSFLNLKREYDNTKKAKAEEMSIPKHHSNVDLKKVTNLNHDQNINNMLEEDAKVKKAEEIEEKLEKKYQVLEQSKLSMENRYKSEMKVIQKKLQQKEEQIEYMTNQFKEIEQKNKIMSFQMNEYKNEQKIYQRKLNDIQNILENNNSLLKEKEQEIKILVGQINSLKKLVKHNAVPPMDKEVAKHIEKIKNEENYFYVTELKKSPEESKLIEANEMTEE